MCNSSKLLEKLHRHATLGRIFTMENFTILNLKTSFIATVASCVMALSTPVFAHDFWIAPESYVAEAGEALDIDIMIGHPTDRLAWPTNPHRIISFRSFGPNGISDRQSSVTGRSKDISIKFKAPGTHLLAIETTQAFSKLESDAFNAYLDEEGLTPIKLHRVRNRLTEQAGTEVYSRRGKSIIQIGKPTSSDDALVTRPIGMTLEIVPTANSARLAESDSMTSQIFYRGQPQSGVTVGLVDLSGDLGLVNEQVSDKKGFVTFKKPSKGAWMQHAVWSDPMEDNNRADYDTIFSSLSFAVP